MDDMRKPTEPKSDQWNFDDFQAGPLTFKIRGVKVKSGQEQPVEISLEGTEKFYRPCKGMCRCMVSAWGADSSKYVGRSLTLYGDPTIKFGGLSVGGIRISHMSDIDSSITIALTVTRANKKPFTVKPIASGATSSSAAQPSASPAPLPPAGPEARADAGPSDVDALLIKAEEWASCGTEKYAAWWTGLTAPQRKAIGTARHEEFKMLAAKVPA